MGKKAAKQGDLIRAMDTHIVMVPSPSGEVPVTQTLPFNGIIDGGLAGTVVIEGRKAAVLGSKATNTPRHVPIGGRFLIPPTNKGTIISGSKTVFFQGRPAARASDIAVTCNDPAPLPKGKVNVPASTVEIGG